jgi:hypothetical protein
VVKNTIAIRTGWYSDDELKFRRMVEVGFSKIECSLPSTDTIVDLISRLRRNDLKATTLTVACPIYEVQSPFLRHGRCIGPCQTVLRRFSSKCGNNSGMMSTDFANQG